MVAAGDVAVEEHTVQARLADQLDAALLHQLARQRIAKRFANLHPSAGQVPAGDVAVLDQEDAAFVV